MSYSAVPVGMRSLPQSQVAILASATAAQFVVCLEPGWNVIDRDEAEAVAAFCKDNGQANRKEPWWPGERIALQGLGRQIRHRLNLGAKS